MQKSGVANLSPGASHSRTPRGHRESKPLRSYPLPTNQHFTVAASKDTKTHFLLTAHGRNNDYEPTGYSLQGCKVTASPELNPSEFAKAFLGRPWFGLSRTVYMQSFLDGLVDPQGWLDSWGHMDTAYCGEYKNYGPGSSTNQRVNWPHYNAITDPKTTEFFTVAHFISGYNWLPETGVPFTPGFENRPVLLN
ncbi:putative pectinesterase [Helianthus annuus]|nr:putative pectinesterase [Helianthus annuus]KAJ0564695.1 putative pectinesterase [Helianthus annuus]KAJ0732732.1 putative pectinesterase [Helianthus annuus]